MSDLMPKEVVQKIQREINEALKTIAERNNVMLSMPRVTFDGRGFWGKLICSAKDTSGQVITRERKALEALYPKEVIETTWKIGPDDCVLVEYRARKAKPVIYRNQNNGKQYMIDEVSFAKIVARKSGFEEIAKTLPGGWMLAKSGLVEVNP